MQELNLVDDRRTAEQLVQSCIRKGYGEARAKQLLYEKKIPKELWEEVLADVNDRDYRDTHRAESPLRQADDAVVVDNSTMTREEQMKHIIDIFDRATR